MASEWIAVTLGLLGIVTAIYSGLRHLVKTIMREFSPNGGQSLKDQVNRIENRLDTLIAAVIKD
jgi:hypothetical protein